MSCCVGCFACGIWTLKILCDPEGKIKCNVGREKVRLTVTNLADRPIQVRNRKRLYLLATSPFSSC